MYITKNQIEPTPLRKILYEHKVSQFVRSTDLILKHDIGVMCFGGMKELERKTRRKKNAV